jgi:hypothetical protein
MAWILSEVVISCYPNRVKICSNVSIEDALKGYKKFRLELSELLVVTSNSCILILIIYLRGMAINSRHTNSMETDSMKHRQDRKIKACLSAQGISFLSCKPKIHYRVYKNMKLVHFPLIFNATHIKTQRSWILSSLVKIKILHVHHTTYLCASWQEMIIFLTSLAGLFCTLRR